MAQVKIFGLKTPLSQNKMAISECIHSTLVEVLKLPKDKCFQRFIALEEEDFIFPAPRSSNYLIIEILLMQGRALETRKLLIKSLFHQFEVTLNFDKADLEIVLIEIPKENFGFRGMTGDEAILDYKINQ